MEPPLGAAPCGSSSGHVTYTAGKTRPLPAHRGRLSSEQSARSASAGRPCGGCPIRPFARRDVHDDNRRPYARMRVIGAGVPNARARSRIECISCWHAYTLTGMFSHNRKSRLETATTGNSVSLFVSVAGLAVQLHMRLRAGLPKWALMSADGAGSQCASVANAQARWAYPRPDRKSVV